jgi:branched-chain amino acid transport system permease protein
MQGQQARGRLARRSEVLTLASAVLVVVAYAETRPNGVPAGILGLGVVGGCLLALHAVGLVLVYRATRVVNFAQVQMSALGGLLFVNLVQRRLLIVGLARACPPCLRGPETVGQLRRSGAMGTALARSAGLTGASSDTRLADARDLLGHRLDVSRLAAATAPGWLVQAEYWLAALLSVAVAVGLVWLLYAGVVKRFSHAPRLVLTVATLGAGQLALTVGSSVLSPLLNAGGGGLKLAGNAQPPIGIALHLPPAVFASADVLIVVVALAAAAGLAWVLRRSAIGVVMRSVADNPQRAQTLGVPLDKVVSRAWLLAGLLGGLASVLAAAQLGAESAASFDFLVRALAAAVVGAMVSVPLAVAGAVAISVMDRAMLWTSGSTAPVAVLLLVLVGVMLLAQHRRASRAEDEAHGAWQAARELRPIPGELRGVPVVRRTVRALAVLGAVVVLAYPWVMSPGQTVLGTATMAYAVIGLSLLVLTGWAGQISLGQGAFAAVGAWVAAVSGLPLPLAVAAGTLAGAAVAVAVGIPALRLRGLNLAVVTLTLGLATSAVLLNPRYLGQSLGDGITRPILLGVDFNDERAFYYLTLAAAAAATVAVVGMRRSRTARALIACRDNERAAESFGIDLVRVRVGAFAISGALASFAGVLLAFAQRGAQSQTFTPGFSVRLFLMVVIGGLGSVAGPLIGALYLGALQLAGTSVIAPVTNLLADPGLGAVVLLLLAPGGVGQLVFGMRDAWLRRVASRLHIDVPSLVADGAGAGRLGGRAVLAPKLRPGGGTVFVPARYALDDQWMVDARHQELVGG